MTADVTQDRRVTEPGLGSSDSAFVDGSRLFWALPSLVHERSGSGSTHPTGYKLMRCLPHTASRPNPGNHAMLVTSRANISRSKSLAPGSPWSRPLRAASGGGQRPALTAPAPDAPTQSRSGRRNASVEQRNSPTRIIPADQGVRRNDLILPLDFPFPIQG